MRDENEPLVSVVVCAYNVRPYLHECVASILAQTYSKLEILIIDDGSEDGSLSVLRDFCDERIRTLGQRNAGKSVALNRAFDEATGTFLAIQDADDLSYPERISKQVAALLENEDVAAVFCGHDLLLDGRNVAPQARAFNRDECAISIDKMVMPAHDPTAMYRLQLAKSFRFDPELRLAQGYDQVLRLGECHPLLVLGECLYTYRARNESATRSQLDLRSKCVARVFEKAYERHRHRTPTDAVRRHRPERLRGNRRRDNDLRFHFLMSVLDQRRSGQQWAAVGTAVQCLRLHPFDFRYYKPLAWALLPFSIVDRNRMAGP